MGRRVLFVLTAYPPSLGGAQLHAHELARALRADGVDVHVATLWRTPRSDWLRGTTVRAPAPGPTRELDGVPVRQLGLTAPERRRVAPAAAAYYAAMDAMRGPLTEAFLPHLREVVADVRPHVVHLSRIGREWLYEAALTAAAEAGVPTVLTPNHHPSWTRRRDRWWWDIYARVDRLLAFTRAEGEALVAGGVAPARIGRASLGVVGGPGGEVPRADAPTVLFLGHAHAYKGIDVLAAAWPGVRRLVPDARLEVVGPWSRGGVGPAMLRRRLRAQPGVEVHGAVDEDAKWWHLQRADVLCVPSGAESLGGVYLEAWAAGAVPVGADIPPVRELLSGSGGGRVVAREPEALARELARLLIDPGQRTALVAAGRRALERAYSWPRAAALAADAYDAVGAGSSP